jgi:TM2 domain-containing membrane protein YozV
MALIKCPECSQEISEKAVSCPRCGFPISKDAVSSLPNTVECLECKRSYSFIDEVCPHCGLFNSQKYKLIQPNEAKEEYSQPTTIIVRNPKSRSMAVLLAMLLGGLGLHKFYLNKPGAGVLYLLFCWTFIPAILGFFEGLNYLFMSDKDFERKYCK